MPQSKKHAAKSKSKSPSYLIALRKTKDTKQNLKFSPLSDNDAVTVQTQRKSKRRLLRKIRIQQQATNV